MLGLFLNSASSVGYRRYGLVCRDKADLPLDMTASRRGFPTPSDHPINRERSITLPCAESFASAG
jgi:hypothetical protein